MQLHGLQFGQLSPLQISALSEGRSWSIETSSARHYQPPRQPSSTKNGLVLTHEEITSQKEEYFKRKLQENAERPADLPPSQGGRYGGFGNTVEPAKNEESEFFSGAWSSISSVSPPNHEKLAPRL